MDIVLGDLIEDSEVVLSLVEGARSGVAGTWRVSSRFVDDVGGRCEGIAIRGGLLLTPP